MKSKQNFKTLPALFLRNPLTRVVGTKNVMFYGGFFELKMLQIFLHKSFFIKNHKQNLKWKKNHHKHASHLKNNKNSSHNTRYKKDIEKGGKWKTKSIRKVK